MVWKKQHILTMGLAASTILAACSPVGPDYQPPRPQLPLAWNEETLAQDRQQRAEELDQWWTLLSDPLLHSLIKRGIAANLDVKEAEARILQARAQHRLAAATDMPLLEASTSAFLSRKSGAVSSASSGESQELYQIGFDADWEIDFFGGARRANEAASARMDAAFEGRAGLLLSLTAEIARNYLELRGYQQRLIVAEKECAVSGKILECSQERLERGLGDQLTVTRAQGRLTQCHAKTAPLKQGAGQSMYRLALLLGLPPGALHKELSRPVALVLPPRLPVILPSELLRRRPDIRQSERQLAAATADIGIAVAELFPSFSLTGLLGLQSSSFGNLLTSASRYWTLGPSVDWSLFESGKTRANIDLARGRLSETEALYEKTVLTALSEVETALLAINREEETHLALAEATLNEQQALQLFTGQYQLGLTSLQEVFQAELTLYQSQDLLIQSEQRLALDRIVLFKAMGGGLQTGNESTERDHPASLWDISTPGPQQAVVSGDPNQ